MFIDQLIRLSPDDNTEIIKAQDNPFDLMARGQFDHHRVTIPPDTIEKLILDINLILDHVLPPPLPQKDLISRKIFPRSVDSFLQ
jgi:hypothetical protein